MPAEGLSGNSSRSPVLPVRSVLVDCHVHLYGCFDIASWLSAAGRNFDQASLDLELEGSQPARVLLVTDGGRELELGDLPDVAGPWALERIENGAAWRATSPDGAPIFLVVGRQVVTAEGLEVLAAPCASEISSGLPLDQTLADVSKAGAIAQLPWAWGKWMGRRGALLARLLDAPLRPGLFFSDNGGRPTRSPKPRLLTLAAQRGYRILRGSDALPFASQGDRTGSFGSLIRGRFDPDRPAASLRHMLGTPDVEPRPFGAAMGWPSALVNQFRLRLPGRQP